MNRVCISGIGIVSAMGNDIDQFMRKALQPIPALEELEGGAVGYPILDESYLEFVPRKFIRKMDRLSQMTAAAVKLAIDHAQISNVPELSFNELGLILDTGFGSASCVCRILEDVLGDDPIVSPLLFPNVVANASSGHASITFGIKGMSSTLGGLGSLMYAFDLLKHGIAERIIIGGADEIIPLFTRAFIQHGVIDKSIPLGEGAVALVLETEQAVVSRNGRILACVDEVSVCTDPGFKPLGKRAFRGGGLLRTVDEVMRSQSNRNISLFVGCSNGSKMLSRNERRAISLAKLNHAEYIFPKEWVGESFGMGSTLAVAVSAMKLYANQLSRLHELEAAVSISGSKASSSNHISNVGNERYAALVNGYDATRGQAMSAIITHI
jgi:3-oxoacyl-[acyl-carrier-protein] synthase II